MMHDEPNQGTRRKPLNNQYDVLHVKIHPCLSKMEVQSAGTVVAVVVVVVVVVVCVSV